MSLAPNQTLVFVPSDRRWAAPRDVVVDRVGRKWAHLKGDNGRVDIETLYVDGGKYTSPGRCFKSWEQYEEAAALERTWVEFRRLVSGLARDQSVSLADVQQAAALLRLPMASKLP